LPCARFHQSAFRHLSNTLVAIVLMDLASFRRLHSNPARDCP
jgi:hypothetical protein